MWSPGRDDSNRHSALPRYLSMVWRPPLRGPGGTPVSTFPDHAIRQMPDVRSHMDGALAHCKRRFLDRLRASRMRVARSRQILGGAAEFHQNTGFVDHFTGFAA